MIDFLRGKPVVVDTDFVVLDVHDVGYRVFCPNPYAFAGKAEQTVTLFIHHHVREDAVQLFGFATREEQALFRKLLDVTGIGPRVAVGVLSGGAPERIVAAIQSDDLTFLTRLPGIGKKTAQRIVLDLKDKLDGIGIPVALGAGAAALSGAEAAASTAAGSAGLSVAWREAKDALMALGYTDAETERAWRDVKGKAGEGDGADKLIKLALQSLYQA
ncbi:Holliday junction branch migration protein RuvA [Paenibacillus antri]|uniref:Holliday junction branch migration complex subunit RuvA n=1 Tax=Paenibacillus antri TaxID=2582848 RepID=A0A5R9GAR9_9BACL|nr:Holliday junction branch migration protein RuvA [Paenibacillus antri]TLS53557.1 Holliday junction branch migration protein RuvA [Paenibacillus antri]